MLPTVRAGFRELPSLSCLRLAQCATPKAHTNGGRLCSAAFMKGIVDQHRILDGPPQEGESLLATAQRVLRQHDTVKKADYTEIAAALWRNRALRMPSADDVESLPKVPDRPARDDAQMQHVEPKKMRRLRGGGTLEGRQMIVHSLVHIESWAMDLSWDIIARFGGSLELPREFFDDFVLVAQEECKHFGLLKARLEEMGSHYGAFPVHEALWQSATESAGSLPARLAVEHCVHEARGLDVMPGTLAKFRNNGDEDTAKLLEDVVYKEEITHCAAGVRWLQFLYDRAHDTASSRQHQRHVTGLPGQSRDAGPSDAPWTAQAQAFSSCADWFHALIRENFRGSIKGPFNEEARAQAGFGPEWYQPLVGYMGWKAGSATPSNQQEGSAKPEDGSASCLQEGVAV